jgi:hypothetical protein
MENRGKENQRTPDYNKAESLSNQVSEPGLRYFTPLPTGITPPSNEGKELKSFTPPTSGINAVPVQKKGIKTFTPPGTTSLPLQSRTNENKTMQLKAEEEEVLQGKGIDQSIAPLSNSSEVSEKRSMPETVRLKMENSFGQNFSSVNLTENNKAKQIGALAYTQGNNINFAPGQFKPETKSGQELLGHELSHVVQQRQGKVTGTTQKKGISVNDSPALEKEADEKGKMAAEGKKTEVNHSASESIQKKDDLESIPQANRNKIKVNTDDTTGGNSLASLFEKDVAFEFDEATKKTINNNVVFSGINEDMKPGFKNSVATMLPLLSNKSLTQVFRFSSDHPPDVTKYSKESQAKFKQDIAYRFTGYTAAGVQKITVEELGVYTRTVVNSDGEKANKAKFDKYFTISGYTPEHAKLLYNTTARLSDTLLASISGVKFLRAGQNPADDKEAGEYAQKGHTITLFDLAFVNSNTILGDAATGFSTLLEQTIMHEIGHAVDATKLRLASNNTASTFKDYKAAFDKYDIANKALNAKWFKGKGSGVIPPASKAQFDKEKAEVDRLWNEVGKFTTLYEDAKKLQLKVQSPSGQEYQLTGNQFELITVAGDNDFRTQTKAGGNVKVTDYADTSWSEDFAEAFALFQTDPQRLKLLRPLVYGYFVGQKY